MANSSTVTKTALYQGRQHEQDLEAEATSTQGTEGDEASAADSPEATLTGDPSDTDAFHKNRYDHLKRRYDERMNEFNDLRSDNESLKEQLSTKAENAFDVSSSMGKEEIMEWTRSNPDAAAIISTLAGSQADERVSKLNKQLEDVQASVAKTDFEKAKLEIRVLIKDFDDVVASTEFHEWSELQDEHTKKDLSSGNAPATAKAIKLFKFDTNWKSPKKASGQQGSADASRAVGTTKSRTMDHGGSGGKTWTASEIKALSPQDFVKHEEEIDKAVSEGRYDPTT